MLPAADSDYPSGPWTGYLQQDGRRIAQDLELTFDDGVLRGAGWDSDGEFVIKGSYDPATREVRWTKKVEGQPNVYFRGFREGVGIWGTYRGANGVGSGFHVWPLRPMVRGVDAG